MKNEYFHQRKISRLFKLQEFSPPCTWHSCLLCLTIPTIFKTTHLQILTMQLFKCKTILSNQLPSHNTKDFGKSHVYYVAWWTHEVCSLQVKALIFHYFYFCELFSHYNILCDYVDWPWILMPCVVILPQSFENRLTISEIRKLSHKCWREAPSVECHNLQSY